MNKVIIAIILFALGISILVFLLRPTPSIPEGYVRFSEAPPLSPTSTTNRIVIEVQGQRIRISDVRAQPQTLQVGEHDFALYGLDLERKYPFAVNFNERDGSFAIALLEEPLVETRILAEESLQNRLKISESEMCRLSVFVGVPVSINTFYSGTNLGLSFCPDAVRLE